MALAVVRDDGMPVIPPLDSELGTEFGWGDRFFFGIRDGRIFDYGDWEARDLEAFYRKDYKARQIDLVQSLPITSASWSIKPAKGDSGEAAWLQSFWAADQFAGGCETPLELIIAQMTSAFGYKRSFHELVVTKGTGDFAGRTTFKRVAWRPQTTCRIARDPRNGSPVGFEQEAYYVGPGINSTKVWPIFVPANRAIVYVHGARRDPINGISEMEIPYWAWKTKQRILFLWTNYLQSVALPRTVVKAQDAEEAKTIARNVAQMNNSGVLPVHSAQGPQAIEISTLDSSGKGAGEFMQMIQWLDHCATNSVLAGFLELPTGAAMNGRGSLALSKDASDFYLQTREADAKELAYEVRRQLYAPLIRWNFGPKARVPIHQFEPLNAEDKSDAVTMLTDLMRSRDPALVPDEFIGELAQQVADYLGMDGSKIRSAFDEAAAAAKAKAAAMAAAGATPTGQAVAGLGGAVNAAGKLLGGATRRAPAQPGAPVAKPSGARGTSLPGINSPPLPTAY